MDIVEFGVLLYAIHLFQNGNKRVVRVIESALLDFYGYSAKKTISLGRAYSVNKTGFNYFLLDALKHRNTRSFVNFSLRCYTDEGMRMLFDVGQARAFDILNNKLLVFANDKKRAQYEAVFSIFTGHKVLKNSQIVKLMGDRGFNHSVSQRVLKDFIEVGLVEKLAGGEYMFFGV